MSDGAPSALNPDQQAYGWLLKKAIERPSDEHGLDPLDSLIVVEELPYGQLIQHLRMMQRNIPVDTAHWGLVSFGQFSLPASVGLLHNITDLSALQFVELLVWLLGEAVRPFALACYAGAILMPAFAGDVRFHDLTEQLCPED